MNKFAFYLYEEKVEMISLKELIDAETDEICLNIYLTGKEIDIMRNCLSDVQGDKIGLSLNLKIANAILDALGKI